MIAATVDIGEEAPPHGKRGSGRSTHSSSSGDRTLDLGAPNDSGSRAGSGDSGFQVPCAPDRAPRSAHYSSLGGLEKGGEKPPSL